MLLHSVMGTALIMSWVLWDAPAEKREAPEFAVQLADAVVVHEDPPVEPVVEPPVEQQPEVLPAVVVEAPPLPELETLPEPLAYPAPRPWRPRHLRKRPVTTPAPPQLVVTPTPAAIPEPSDPPVSVVMAPAIDNAQCPPPDYPRRAQRLRWQGLTLLLVDVDANGNPAKITVRTSSGYEILDDAATQAVARWHFHPAKRNGVAEAGQLLVPIRFEAPN